LVPLGTSDGIAAASGHAGDSTVAGCTYGMPGEEIHRLVPLKQAMLWQSELIAGFQAKS
jgi:hypothetical protein